MKAEEFLHESRGVTAREPGEQYVSDVDPQDMLTIQEINIFPPQGSNYESLSELEDAIKQSLPANADIVNDNNKNSGTLAAIVVTVTDKDNRTQYWIRYIKSIPSAGIHGLWKTLRGYKYTKGAKTEQLPVKPTDFVNDEQYRSADQLVQTINSKIGDLVKGTGHEVLETIMKDAVSQAQKGTSNPIPQGWEYNAVMAKYAGEYLGPIALIDATNTVGGNTQEILKHFELNTLSGSEIMFPQDTSFELVDSVLKTPQGKIIQISSKISKAGGAASSIVGIWNNLTDDVKQQYPRGSKIIELLATNSSVNGPVNVAVLLKILDNNDVTALNNLDKASQNPQDLKTARLQKLLVAQPVAPGTQQRTDYRVFYHVLTAIANTIMLAINQDEEFRQCAMASLNNNQYIQLITRSGKRNADLVLEYSTKFPAVFEGKPVIFNKSYFATGQKGRLGFKLK